MRELTVDFNSENPLQGGNEAGYIGENNATKLIIKPSAEMLGSGSSFFVVAFLSKGDIFRTEQFEPAEEIEVMLGAHLTRDHYLSMQLEGYSEEDLLVCKSPMISKIHFMPSISGNESEIDADDFLIGAQVALNSNARHSHENAEVIDTLSENDGKLLYNGKKVCRCSELKSVVLSVEKGEVDSVLTTTSRNLMELISYQDAESFAVPQNAEIESIELNIDEKSCPEWIDLRDMIMLDPESTYILNYRKTFYDEESGITTFCRVVFLDLYNKFANFISAFLLKNVRINYYENQETA